MIVQKLKLKCEIYALYMKIAYLLIKKHLWFIRLRIIEFLEKLEDVRYGYR